MKITKDTVPKWVQRVIFFSLLLIFFTIPHTLEDFATGEPAARGIPVPALSLVVSTIFFLQAIGLLWLGRGERRGILIHLGIGLFWPIASGLTQLPAILSEATYRSGAISIIYVIGIIVIGSLLFASSIMSLIKRKH